MKKSVLFLLSLVFTFSSQISRAQESQNYGDPVYQNSENQEAPDRPDRTVSNQNSDTPAEPENPYQQPQNEGNPNDGNPAPENNLQQADPFAE